jgi:hypothetical protein
MTVAPIENVPIGILARDYVGLRLPLMVLESAAGFYIGTSDSEIGPVSRESNEYFSSYTKAEEALISGRWTQKENP